MARKYLENTSERRCMDTYECSTGKHVGTGSDVGRPQVEGILLQGHVKLARFVTMRRGVEDETGVQLDILWKVKVHQLVQFSTLVRCLSKGDSVWLLALHLFYIRY